MRDVLGLSLREAKDLIDSRPPLVRRPLGGRSSHRSVKNSR